MDTVDYFHLIIFSCLILLVITATTIIVRLSNRVTELSYELKLGRNNYQKDLDRLEERVNQIASRDTESYRRELEKIEKLHRSISKMVDEREDEVRIAKKLLND